MTDQTPAEVERQPLMNLLVAADLSPALAESVRVACLPYCEGPLLLIAAPLFEATMERVLDQMPGARGLLASRRAATDYWAKYQRAIDAKRAEWRAALGIKPPGSK